MAKPSQPSLFGEPAAPVHVADGVVIREVTCRSLLNCSQISDYTFNCYTGCANACAYCYARFMQRFHPHDEPWGCFVDVKVNAAAVLARQLRRLKPGSVFTCSACDGWQEVEADYRLTRECCRLLVEAGFHLNVLTKSDLVLRDLDIFAGHDVSVGVTITTADESLARLWEPRASSVAGRLNILRQAKAAGLKTTVSFSPLLPELSDTPAALRELFALAAGAGVDRIWTDTLNARPRVWPSVQNMLRRWWPGLLDHYRRVLFEDGFRSQYQGELNQRIRRAASEAGVLDRLA